MKIAEIRARQVFDSRSNPTVEVDVILQSGAMGRAIVPSGASTGIYEALELRDQDPSRYMGKSVFQAVTNVKDILAPQLIGMDASDQRALDNRMILLDGTENKSRLGANAILGISMAAAKACANQLKMPLYRYLGGAQAHLLPMPMIQIIGGGLHADSVIDLQDFLVIPVGAGSFSQAMEMTYNVYNATKKVYHEHNLDISVSDEGGFWPRFSSNEQAMQILTQGIQYANYIPGQDVAIALDVASSHFYKDQKYHFAAENKEMTTEEFVDILESWVDKYPIISMEDCCAEDDWSGWELVSNRLGQRIQLIGDDLFTTNIQRIQKGVELGVCNSVLIKMNQIGTLTETLDAIEETKKAGYLPVVSARSGETEDTTMVDLCLATNAGQIKVGSIARSERLAKYNELLRIEEELGESGIFARREVFKNILS
ncbi:phosphopyruvate hydratase [Ammoniphilus resinae]|uniref:Enolase n=1 Tax=Ammoniphilus resinae TaxID=861532 RepID=A0ABS4GLW3_9BACL|nr:phosphopyruvate hydratase [Ammoniphilus resinae]MBP1931256.1 enolase [Ammoniphilus resinae]